MGTQWTLAGKEVPITGSDAVRWIDLSVSSSSNVAVDGGAAISEDRASCSVIGDPPTYLIWSTPSPSPISSATFRKFHHFTNRVHFRAGEFTRHSLKLWNCLSSLLPKNFLAWDSDSVSPKRFTPSRLSAKTRLLLLIHHWASFSVMCVYVFEVVFFVDADYWNF